MPLSAWYGRAFVLAGALSALVPAVIMWGFTVDDALIPLRYAHHLASGSGYRFDAHGPVTDGVTPLVWAPLLTPLARADDLLVVLERVKTLGALAWTLGGASLGHALAKRANGERRATVHAAAALFVVALAFPIGAWAASGMETGIATALATFAAGSFARPWRAAAFAGAAASFRPELVVWALVVSFGAAIASEKAPLESGALARRVRAAGLACAIAFAPFAVCTAVRLVLFGRASPLSLQAKPSDLAHGFVYAGAAFVVVLTPLLALSPGALRRSSPLALSLAVAFAAHVLVVVAVGGDWMPYARLMVPVAPGLALVYVDVGRVAHRWSSAARAIVAFLVGAAVAMSAAPAGRHVHDDRKALIVRARPLLAHAKTVAALDVGWVGAATDADIVDLAGLTDPEIAALPGGHTSKPVDMAMLLERGVDTIVLYSQPRIVERRLMRSPLLSEKFELAATVELRGEAMRYSLFRRR